MKKLEQTFECVDDLIISIYTIVLGAQEEVSIFIDCDKREKDKITRTLKDPNTVNSKNNVVFAFLKNVMFRLGYIRRNALKAFSISIPNSSKRNKENNFTVNPTGSWTKMLKKSTRNKFQTL